MGAALQTMVRAGLRQGSAVLTQRSRVALAAFGVLVHRPLCVFRLTEQD